MWQDTFFTNINVSDQVEGNVKLRQQLRAEPHPHCTEGDVKQYQVVAAGI